MKRFDLEKAVAGHWLITGTSQMVTEFHVFRTSKSGHPIACAVLGEEEILTYDLEGRYSSDGNESPFDLFLAEEEDILKVPFTQEQIKAMNTSPALTGVSDSYPIRYNGFVPKTVKMLKMATPDLARFFGNTSFDSSAYQGEFYPVWVNKHGAVAVIFEDGKQLGVKPNEFEVVTFHEEKQPIKFT